MQKKIVRIGIALLWIVSIIFAVTNFFTFVGIARGFIARGDSEFIPVIFMIACVIAGLIVTGGSAGGHLLGMRRNFIQVGTLPSNIKRNIDYGVVVTYLAGGIGCVLWTYRFFTSTTPHEFTVMYINLLQAPTVLFLAFGLRRMSRTCGALLLCIYAFALVAAQSLGDVVTTAIQSFFLIRGLLGAIQYHKWAATNSRNQFSDTVLGA